MADIPRPTLAPPITSAPEPTEEAFARAHGWAAVLVLTAAHYGLAAATLLPLLARADETRARLFEFGQRPKRE